jgi:nitroreductase
LRAAWSLVQTECFALEETNLYGHIMKRRTFLEGTGAVLVLVTGGGVWRAYDRGVFSVGRGPAYEPWKNWRGETGDGPLALVRAAILAASAVNTQPWLFKVTSSSIELYADQRRNTGAFDPYQRELHISLGCALENLVLAAEANGYQTTASIVSGKLDVIPANPGTELIAHVTLEPGEQKVNELYNAIPQRHTNRFPFDSQKPIPPDFVEVLSRTGSEENDVRLFLFTTDADRQRVVDVLGKGAGDLAAYPEMFQGSARWFRDWKATQRARDGLTLDDFGQPPLATALLKFLPESVQGITSPLQVKISYVDLIMTGRLFGAIAVRDRYEQSQNIRAGRLWQRAHLLATARGLAARPANQTAELVDQERLNGKEPRAVSALAALTGDAGWQTTFMFYMGYATREAHATVRRPVEDVVV